MPLIDITLSMTSRLATWKNEDSGLRLTWVDQFGIGGSENCTSRVSYGSHLGTHLDAPLHFVEGGGTVDQIDPEILIGACFVVDLTHCDGAEISADVLQNASIPHGTSRLLLKTANSTRRLLDDASFHDEFVAIGPSAAEWIAAAGVRLVGIDYLSIGSATTGNGGHVHRIILGAGIVAVEALNLADVKAGGYILICLPLKVAGAEGAPVRAILAPPDHFTL